MLSLFSSVNKDYQNTITCIGLTAGARMTDGQSACLLALRRHCATQGLRLLLLLPSQGLQGATSAGNSDAGIYRTPRGSQPDDEIRRRYMQMADEPFH